MRKFIEKGKKVLLTVISLCFLIYTGTGIRSSGAGKMLEIDPKKMGSTECASIRILGLYYEEDAIRLYKMIEKAEVTLLEEDIKTAQKAVEEVLQKEPDHFLKKYFLAKIYHLWGIFYDVRQDKKVTKFHLEKALSETKASINLNDQFSDAYRLAADLYGWLIDLKGAMFWGPFYSPKANSFLKKAEELDANNPEVYLAQGRKYLYTPTAFGGNKKKAIESFEHALNLCPNYYLAHIWLGQAYVMQGWNEKAKMSFERALSIEPASGFAKTELDKLVK